MTGPDEDTAPDAGADRDEALTEAARRRRRAAVFGEVLPEVTGDERDDSGERPGSEEWLRAQVPPHHG